LARGSGRLVQVLTQSLKFDKDCLFIKQLLPQLDVLPTALIHKEYGLKDWAMFIGDYPTLPIVDTKSSRLRAIERFKN